MIITADNNYRGLDDWFEGKKKTLLVCGNSINNLGVLNKLNSISVPIIQFSDFQPNPLYESVVKGVKLFREEGCDSIMAVGGGSAMDVAKCIKLFAGFPGNGVDGSWLSENNASKDIPFIAMPTTAGTGSEATRFAIIYYNGEKQSVTNDSIIPDTVLFDANALKSLPLYQKKATMCDALCHAIESYWSVSSTYESKELCKKAIRGILDNLNGYLDNTDEGNQSMLMAAYEAGRAINITRTTAGHAMCYKITSLLGCAHGHSVILCVRMLYPHMIENIEKCADFRGVDYLKDTLDELGRILGGKDAFSGAERLKELFISLELDVPFVSDEQLEIMVNGVKPEKLNNHPVKLNKESVRALYKRIFDICE